RDWSSDVCSSDLNRVATAAAVANGNEVLAIARWVRLGLRCFTFRQSLSRVRPRIRPHSVVLDETRRIARTAESRSRSGPFTSDRKGSPPPYTTTPERSARSHLSRASQPHHGHHWQRGRSRAPTGLSATRGRCFSPDRRGA